MPSHPLAVRARAAATVLLAGAFLACAGVPTGDVPVPGTPNTPGVPENPPTTSEGASVLAMATGEPAAAATENLIQMSIVVRAFNGQKPAAGVTVKFGMKAGSGSVNPTEAVTDANGDARTTLTFPYDELNTVLATSGESTRTETSIGHYRNHDGWIRSVGGPFLQGTPGQPLGSQLAVLVLARDGKTPLTGRAVKFTVEMGGGALSATTATTGSDGVARVSWTLGTGIGVNRVQVSGDKLIPVTIHATAVR